MPDVLVIGDDFTGVNATAALYAGAGLTAVTAASIDSARRLEADVLLLSTQTRELADRAAATRVLRAVTELGDFADLVVKRVDPTLRGNVGPETAAMLSVMRRLRPAARVVGLVVPASPALGRTTRDGVHYLDGEPVAETWAGHDPFSPVRASAVAEIMALRAGPGITEVRLGEVRAGIDRLAFTLAHAARRADLIVADAVTHADLRALARAATRAAVDSPPGDRLSWIAVDSGPFGAELAAEFATLRNAAQRAG
ncbi:MAG: four-carbon acid sugar kinase family protein, partial [Bifidobacteriaceae bacterium]|nr:four-carbon acid sugar kinase family protein [Bifidobacteriaceae bacterium]